MFNWAIPQARRKLFVIGGGGGLKPRAEGLSRAPLAGVLLGGGSGGMLPQEIFNGLWGKDLTFHGLWGKDLTEF